MQEQMEDVKNKLNNISLVGEADNGSIKVVANGNRMLNTVSITNETLQNVSKEQLERLIVSAANRALEQAERVEKAEMSNAAMGMLPGLG